MNYRSFLPFLVLVVLLFGCGRRNQLPVGYELYTSSDYSLASSEFSSISNLISLESRQDSSIYRIEALYCPNALRSLDVSNPSLPILTLDFGVGSTCIDGRTRAGKLKAEFHGRWTQAGSYIDISPESYSVNSMAVDFNKRVTNNGRDSNGNMKWNTVISNGVITTNLGPIFYEENRITLWTAGEGGTIWDYTDNEYEISGNANGTARNGIQFTANVDVPLLVKMNCSNIVQGVLRISPENLTDRVIDYGQGICDKIAVLSIGDYTAEINLP